MANDERLAGSLEFDTTSAKTNISELNRNIRVLESSFKATAAELGDWTKTAEGNESRIKTLTGVIDSQRQKVDNLADEYERVAAEQGASSKAAQDLEIKLNNETAALNKNSKELQDCEKRLDEFANEADDAGNEAKELGNNMDDVSIKGGKLKDVLGKVGSVVKSGLSATLTAVKNSIIAIGTAAVAAAAGIFKLGTDAGVFADDIITLSNKTGIGVEALQEWQYAARFVDVEVETMTGSMAKLIKNMDQAAKGGKNQVQAFADLGIEFQNVDGTLKDSQETYFEIIDALGQIENETERDAIAMNLFGKSAQELNPLIKAGSAELRRLGEEARATGLVLDEAMVAKLGEFDDVMQVTQAQMQGIGRQVAVLFLPALQSVGTAVSGLLTDINLALTDGIQPGEIQEIGQKISGFLVSGLQKIVEYLPAVIEVLTMVVSEAVGMLVEFMPELLPQLLNSVLALFTGAIEVIAKNIDKIAEMITFVIKSLVAFISDNLPIIITAGIDILLALISGLIEAIPDLIKAIPQIITAIVGALAKAAPKLFDIGKDLIKGLWEGILSVKDWIWSKIAGFFGGIVDGIKSFFGIKSPSRLMASAIGEPITEGIAVGITDALPAIDEAMKRVNAELMVSAPTPTMTTADQTNALLQGMQMSLTPITTAGENAASERQPVIFQIDGATLGKIMLPLINTELNRRGLKPIIT